MKRTREQIFAMHEYLKRCASLFNQINPRGCKLPTHDEGHELLLSVVQEIYEEPKIENNAFIQRFTTMLQNDKVGILHFYIDCSLDQNENAQILTTSLAKRGHYFCINYTNKKNHLELTLVSEKKFDKLTSRHGYYFHNKAR